MKPKALLFLLRVHLLFFAAGAGYILGTTYYFLAQPWTFALDTQEIVLGTCIISVASVLLHIGAFDLTMEAIRRGGTSIEKNPISRFLFRKLGFNRTLWATCILMAVLIGWSVTTDPTSSELNATATVFVGLNLLDYANDRGSFHAQLSVLMK